MAFETMLPQLAAWSLVILTLERLVLVTSPINGKQMMTRSRVIKGWLITAGVLILACPVGPIVKEYRFNFYMGAWTWVRASIQSFLPACFMLVANVVIIVKLAVRAKKRQGMTNKSSNDKSTTFMLLAVSFAFILLTPWYALFNVSDQLNTTSNLKVFPLELPAQTTLEIFCSCIGRHLLYLNSAVNFFLYCVSGSKFREELREMLGCKLMKPVHV
jgi:hypothetical protein